MTKPILTYESGNRRRRTGWFFWFLLPAVLLISIGVYILMPTLNRPREHFNWQRCASNLKEIAQAMLLYENDTHGVAAPDLAALCATQDLPPEILVCGSTNDTRSAATQPAALRLDLVPKSGHCSYVYVGYTGPLGSLHPNTVLAYEPPSNHPELTTMTVLFADGHVELVDLKRAQSILAIDQAGTRPIILPP